MAKKGKKKNKLKWYHHIGTIIYISIFVIIGIILQYLYICWQDLPTIEEIVNYKPNTVSVIYDRNDNEIGYIYKEKRFPISIDSIPPLLKNSLIAVEDRDFYRHWGINIKGIFRALFKNIIKMKVKEGGSTITQQLARSIFLTYKRTFTRKIKEAFLAIKIEKAFTKDEILEMYFNQIYYGSGAYGIKAAAYEYFGKPLDSLNISEIAMLTGLPKGPSYYNPFLNKERAIKRRNVVLSIMRKRGVITEEQYVEALKDTLPLRDRTKDKSKSIAPYFMDIVRKEFYDAVKDMPFTGFKVYTTIDTTIQRVARESIRRHLRIYEKRYHYKVQYDSTRFDKDGNVKLEYLQGALMMMDVYTGDVIALVGGRDYYESPYNRATQAYRQPGSAFKPFVYTVAIKSGKTEGDIIQDSPMVLEAGGKIYRPENYDGTFMGPITLKKALALSRNIPALRTIQEIGPRKVKQFVTEELDFNPKYIDPVLSLALGSCLVRVEDMVSAYTMFANGGKKVYPRFIRRIETLDGQLVKEFPVKSKRVLDNKTAFIMNDLLQTVVNSGTGRLARIFGYRCPAGGKTGTTNDYSDAWFVGFDPLVTCGVWVGFDDVSHKIGNKATGAGIALPIWTDVMKAHAKKYGCGAFPIPSGLVKLKICGKSGEIAGPYCPVIEEDYFIRGTEPLKKCHIHKGESGGSFEKENNIGF